MEKKSEPCGRSCFLHIVWHNYLSNFYVIIYIISIKDSVKEKIIIKKKQEEERRSSRKLNNTNDSGNEASSEDSNDSIKSLSTKGMSLFY